MLLIANKIPAKTASRPSRGAAAIEARVGFLCMVRCISTSVPLC
jgi:hypothetical protein